MARKQENTGFLCSNCKKEVLPIKKGTIRNHCPFCLFSKHLDIQIGDRLSDCGGDMPPISSEYNTQKGWQIVHKCQLCGKISKNILADDDNTEILHNLHRKKQYKNL